MLLGLVGWTLILLATSSVAFADAVRPQASDPRLEQLAAGQDTYRFWCSACHAYSGEGLTQAWISTWAPDDQNCWQSKCHAVNHPPDGFVLPRSVPAIVGPKLIDTFQNGAGLFAYISSVMPYQEPGVLSDEEYYAVLAHLLRLNRIDYGSQALGPDNIGGVVLGAAGGPAPVPMEAEASPAPVMPPSEASVEPPGAPNAGLLAGGILGSLALAAVAAMAAAHEKPDA
jgi:mono/diheme cytochrome c family protein